MQGVLRRIPPEHRVGVSKRKKSPCVDVCIYLGPKNWCLACAMTREEARGWRAMKPYGRNALLKQLQRRKSEMKARQKPRS